MQGNTREQRGLATLHQIAGDPSSRPLGDWSNLGPDMRGFIVEFIAGDVLSRPGLDLKSRQLATVAMLAAQGHAPDEYKMHLAGALRVGWTRAELVELILQTAPFAGFPCALNALKWAKEVFDATPESESAAHSLVAQIFAADAALDADAFVNLLAPDVAFRMGAQPEIHGRQAVHLAISGLFKSMQSIRHSLIRLWVQGTSIAVRATTTMTAKDGHSVTLRYMNSIELGPGGLIADYRIHIDLSAMMAPRS